LPVFELLLSALPKRRAECMSEGAEHLPSKCEALSCSNPSTENKKKEKSIRKYFRLVC
jgi:hypothetical protein